MFPSRELRRFHANENGMLAKGKLPTKYIVKVQKKIKVMMVMMLHIFILIRIIFDPHFLCLEIQLLYPLCQQRY